MEKIACSFTGHRPRSFPWKYDEAARDCVLLKEVLTAQVRTLVDKGVTDFLSGMAQGVDLWSAQIVLNLRQNNPNLKLYCILPCEEQDSEWPPKIKEQYRSLLEQANDVIYTGREYSKKCMLKRNHYLVDHSSILLAVYNGSWRSGTGATVRYAQKQHREIILIDPITRNVSQQ